MMKLKKLDYINVAALVLSVLGLLLQAVGAAISTPETVGLNFALSPILYVGVVLCVAGLACAIVGSMKTEKEDLDKKISTLALYVSVIAVLATPIVVVLTIVWPVLNPTNG